MITLKYQKTGRAIYLSHIDVLRHLNRTFRRAGIEVEFSLGFNPHMLTKLGIPLPLGTYSSAEYVTVNTPFSAEEFLKKYNEVCVEGMEGLKAFDVQKNPNLAGKVVFAEYYIPANAMSKKEELENLPKCETLVIDYPTRKEPMKTKDIGGLVKSVKVFETHIQIVMDAVALRADVLANSLARKYAFDVNVEKIFRINQFVKSSSGGLVEVDKFLEDC